jgi:predicted dehydrogenase
MSTRKIKVGVFGGGRGQTMIDVLSKHPDAELVAICDKYQPLLDQCQVKATKAGSQVTCYEDFDRFFEHDMDAVVLANYATEHAPYAIRLLDSGRHVTSEIMAAATMGEAVELVEAVERNHCVYTYAENYCYFRGCQEMQRLYRSGVLGRFMHGEGEYIHDCGPFWGDIAYGERDHWRNWMPSTYYCTHALGPIVTITGARPVRVTGYETPNVLRRSYGCLSSDAALVACQMDNGAITKFIPSAGVKREPAAIWFAVYGTKGSCETDRWNDGANRVYLYTEEAGEMKSYKPDFPLETEVSKTIGGHGGSDFYTMHFFLESILGREGGSHAIDVYTALDMTLPGILAYRSICTGNQPFDVPNMRIKADREKWRGDEWSVDPAKAGPGQPTPSSDLTVDVPDELYLRQNEDYLKRHRT